MTTILEYMEQGPLEWKLARIGCITMSHAATLIANGRGGKPSVGRETYLIDVASEIISGMPAEEINVWAMQRGIILEPYARRAYEALTGFKVNQVGLGYLDDKKRIAASPDGLIEGRKQGVEIKCPGAKEHLRTILSASIPDKYNPQVQGCMWVFGLDSWDYVSFCPEFKAQPLFIVPVDRDQEMIDRISASAINGVAEVDAMVAKARRAPAHMALNEICKEAIETIDILQGKDQEIY